jgi:two-component sensor histidine kinase
VAHARTILQGNANATAIQADARQPDKILDHAEVKSLLDFSQPAAALVLDNGVGLPKDLDFRDTQSLGLQLVNTLVEQLEGTIELDRSGEAAFKITFTEPKCRGRG